MKKWSNPAGSSRGPGNDLAIAPGKECRILRTLFLSADNSNSSYDCHLLDFPLQLFARRIALAWGLKPKKNLDEEAFTRHEARH